MGEQWFLDLDGVRSGPYDDEEIVALLKEGELLPHHKISYSVDQPEWQTMIEWRLKKAFRDAAIQSSNTTTTPKVRNIEIRDQEAQTTTPPRAPMMEEITDVKARPPVEPLHEIEQEAQAMAHTFIARIPRTVVEQSQPRPELTENQPSKSRDAAVGQLLDLYQNIRGKRQETKQALESSVAAVGKQTPPEKTSILKPALLILGLGALGYGAGRLWNGSSAPTTGEDPVVTTSGTSAATPTPSGPESRTVEHKSDKFTIRAVTNQPKFIPQEPPTAKPTPKVDFSAEQLNELKQLRNEIEELRALQGTPSSPGQNPSQTPNAPVDNGSLLDPRLLDPGQGGVQNGAPPPESGQENQ